MRGKGGGGERKEEEETEEENGGRHGNEEEEKLGFDYGMKGIYRLSVVDLNWMNLGCHHIQIWINEMIVKDMGSELQCPVWEALISGLIFGYLLLYLIN